MPQPESTPSPIPQRVLDERFAEYVPLGLKLLGVLYGFYALAYGFLLEPAQRGVMVPLSVVSALVPLCAGFGLDYRGFPSRFAHPIGCAAVGLVATNVFAHVYLARAPVELVALMILLIAMSSFFLSLFWYSVGAALLLVSGWAVGLASGFGVQNATVAIGVLAASFAGGIIQHFRVRGIRRYEELLLERSEVARELRESQAGYRLLVDRARDLIVTFDAEGHFTYLSPSFEAMLGRRQEEFVGQHVADSAVTGALAEELGRLLGEIQCGERDEIVFETPLLAASGDVVWCEVLAGAVHGGDGQLEEIHVVARDVSQRRAAEEELRLAQFSVDQAGDTILRVSRKGAILSANETALETLGYARDEIVRLSIADLFPRFDMKDWGGFWQMLRENEVLRFESTQHGAGGEKTPVELVVKLIEHGGEEEAFAFVRDATDRKNAEEALRNAKEVAERATASKSEFLATMSHEMRTPLNGVIGIGDLLSQSALSPEQREQVELLRVSGEALLRIIDNLLDFSKIEASMLELEEADFEPGPLLEEVSELFAAVAQREDLEVVCDIGAQVPAQMRGDAARLRQVLSNLVSNAVKFTAEGEIVLRVRRVRFEAPEIWLRFEVVDTGVGIEADAQERIFASFVQASPATAREFGGSGLGLAVCRQLATLMGGELKVESQPGEGSCFQFEVPFRESAQRRPDVETAPPGGAGAVLLFEPNARQREALRERLECWGVPVDAVASADAAREALSAAGQSGRRYETLLLAVSDRERAGIELGRELQSRPELREAERIWLTPIPTETLRRDLDAVGGRRITKPVRAARLAEALGAPPSRSGPSSRGSDATPLATRLRLLVAEDNAVNRKLAEAMLDRLEVDYEVVSDGAAAVEAVRCTDYDGVLMDCHMPGMDGFEATRRIRALDSEHGRHTHIVAVTASAMAGDRARCLEAGMDGHLAKPLRYEALAQALRPLAETPLAIDETLLMDRVEGDRELARDLSRIFLEQLPTQLVEIERRLSAGDAEGLARAAHALVGSAAHFGIEPVSQSARELEQTGLAGRVEAGVEIYRRLERALDEARPALRALSNETSA